MPIFASTILYKPNENIIALSTPSGIAALATVRTTGMQVIEIVNQFFSKDILSAKGSSVHYGFIEKKDGQTIDEVVITVFKAPKSFTGEDMVEISCHGSPIVVSLIIEELTSVPNMRLAEPGEFSLRAFLNGKIDLVKAESIADIIHSETESAQKIAINQLKNGFSVKLETLRQELIDLAALLELELDFGEEDVEFAQRDKLESLCNELIQEITKLIGSFKYGNAIKNGIQTAIVGKPNAGKSTLLNAILNEDRAIVSDIAGTTRDTLEEKWVVNGVLFNLIDTAGLRENTEDIIEKLGIERTNIAIEKAGLVIYLIDASQSWDDIMLESQKAKQIEAQVLMVFTKSDSIADSRREEIIKSFPMSILISAVEEKIESLVSKLGIIAEELNSHGTSTLVTNQRHLEALNGSKVELERVIYGLKEGLFIEQLASDLKNALSHLGSITGGTISANEILSSVFSRFCIGK